MTNAPDTATGSDTALASRPRRSLRALILSDGLPGHVNQSRGLVRWLGERFDVHASEVSVALRAKAVSRRLLPLLANRGGGLAAFRTCHRAVLPAEAPDVVISAGGNTASANVLLARHWRCANVFLGSKRHLDGRCFTAHLTLEPTGEPANIVMNIAPSPLLPTAIADAGQHFLAQRGLEGQRLWLMACGGNGAGIVYRPAHWQRLGEWMNDIAERYGIRWLVSTSRRTGAAAEAALRSALAPEHIAYAVWWAARQERILGAMMGASERLFATVDSMAMICECIASGKALTLVYAGRGQPNERYRNALEKFERLGTCHPASTDAAFCLHPLNPPPAETLMAAQLDELEARLSRAL